MSRYVSELGDSDGDLGDAPAAAPAPAPAPTKEDLLKVAITDPMVAASVKATTTPAPPSPPKPKPPEKPPVPGVKKSPPRPLGPYRRAPPTEAIAPIPSPGAAAPTRSRKGLLVVAAVAAGVTGLVLLLRRKDNRERER